MNSSMNRSTRSFRASETIGNTYYPRVFGANGAISSHHYLSATAGIEMLKQGGNAVDAAAAAVLVEGVVNQQMHSIGGELPILIGSPESSAIVSINGNMVAPGAATPEAFRIRGHGEIPAEGILAAGVPGALGGLVEALRRFGKLTFAQISEPAILAARKGFPAHSGLLRQHKFGLADNIEKFRQEWPATGQLYLKQGELPCEGVLIRNEALAGMYEHLASAERGASTRDSGLKAVFDAFYRGDIAREIVSFAKDRGGLLERSDFDKYYVLVEQSACIEFHGISVHKCGPWTQGPALLQSLSILKSADLASLGHNSAQYIHLLVEAIKLAFADREQYYGDPQFVPVPMEVLLSDDYGLKRATLISAAASIELRPGDAHNGHPLLPKGARLGGGAWGPGTVHVNSIDVDGCCAAFTPSGGWIRSSEVIPSLGFPLGSRLSNFHLGPANHPNIIAPFKRPRTTISPSIAVRDGRPWLAFGSMGGDQQDQWQLQFLLNRLVFGMSVQKAIEAPKFSSEHFPAFFAPHDLFLNRLRIEPDVGDETIRELSRLGHDIDVSPSWSEGFICATEYNVKTNVVEAGADPRGTKSEVFPACALAW